MAIFSASVPVDFVAGHLPQGDVVAATANYFAISDGIDTAYFYGEDLTYGGSYVLSGTLEAYEWEYGGAPAIVAYDFLVDAATAWTYILNDNTTGFLSYILSFDDDIYASDYSDVIAGFTGNDFLSPGAGDDVVYGGTGVDAVYLVGSIDDYEILEVGPGAFQVTDLNITNGSEGSDLIYDVELVEFSDGTIYSFSDFTAPAAWFEQPDDIAVVAATYQFFTGSIPTAAGFEYLISSPVNPNDLNDPYYASFNIENRYINFASNLGTSGEGAAFFDFFYDDRSFEETLKDVYFEVMGKELSGPALTFFLGAEGYYEAVAAERVVRPGVDLEDATKIVAIGSILNEAVKSDTGPYADAIDELVADVAPDGTSPLLGEDLFWV